MKSIHSTQYTIRNIPQPVDRLLRERAKKQGKSFNQTVVDALKQATGATEEPVIYHDLDWFFGGGSIDQKAFNEAIEAQEKIDPEKWA